MDEPGQHPVDEAREADDRTGGEASPALRAYLDLMAAEVGMTLPASISAEDAEDLRLMLQDLTGRGATPPKDEPLAERVEREGVVDQQAMILPDARR